MSLKKCKECENMVSSEAKTCPYCGAKLRKSAWKTLKIIISIILSIFMLGMFFQILHSSQPYLTSTVSEKKKSIEDTVKAGLTEKVGVPCISVTLTEKSKNNFVGDAKLEDGREFDITATPEGDYVRYSYTFKRGYEYKCKHHIDQIKLRISASATKGVLCGSVWNDESHPVRGFVAIEFIDKNGSVYHTARAFVYNPYELRMPIYSPYEPENELTYLAWIPPGEKYSFSYLAETTLLKYTDTVRVEFFNIKNEELGFVNLSDKTFSTFNLQLLQIVDVKLTGKTQQVEEEIYRPLTMEDVDRYLDYQVVLKTGTRVVSKTEVNRRDDWLARLLQKHKNIPSDFLQIAETKSSLAILIAYDLLDWRRYSFDVNAVDRLWVPVLLESVNSTYGDTVISLDAQEIIKQMHEVVE